MIKYYRNEASGKLISFNDANNEVVEFEELETIEQPGSEVLVRKKRKVKAEKTAAKKIRGGGEPDKRVKNPAGGNCEECGNPAKRGYLTKGKCEKCYARGAYQKKHGKTKGHEADGRGQKYECIDCGQEITSTLDIDRVKCPKNSNHQIIQK